MDTSDCTSLQLALFPLEKRCSKCGVLKTIGAFHVYPPNRDGFKAYCTACDRAIYQAKRWAAVRDTMQRLGCTRRAAQANLAREKAELKAQHDAAGLKRCSDCHMLRPRTDYHRSQHHADGLTNICKTCVKVRRRANYQANRARVLVQTRTWERANRPRVNERGRLRRQSHPEIYGPISRRLCKRRRVRKAGASGRHTEAEWQTLCATYNNACVRCGLVVPLTEDHIIPLSKGGSDWIDNIQPLCGRCNSLKGTRTTRYIP